MRFFYGALLILQGCICRSGIATSRPSYQRHRRFASLSRSLVLSLSLSPTSRFVFPLISLIYCASVLYISFVRAADGCAGIPDSCPCPGFLQCKDNKCVKRDECVFFSSANDMGECVQALKTAICPFPSPQHTAHCADIVLC